MSTYGFGLYGGAGGTYAEPWTGTLLPTDIAAIAQAVFDLGANVVSVNGTNTTSIDDFKLTASEVWSAPITVAAGTQGLYNTIAGGILVDTTVTGTPTTTEVQLTAGSTIDDFYNDQLIQFLSGTGVGQIRVITDYVGATKTIIVDEVFATTPIATDRVIIKSDHVHPLSQIQSGLATSTNVTDAQASIIAQVDANETKIDALETKASRLDALIENATGDRFTAKALETAPTAEMSESELHTALDSYTNKGNWMANISALALEGSLLTTADLDAALATYGGPTLAQLNSAFTEIKGSTWTTTDTLEAIRDRGDSAWLTATGFSTFNPATDTVVTVRNVQSPVITA